ncbi:MAG: DUF6178 family protein [Myxococcota bacterium]
MSQEPSERAPLRQGLQESRAAGTDLRLLRERLRTLPAKKRLDAILERPDVMRVVRSLPVQDVLLTVKEVGASDCLELVELLSPKQVQGLLDLDAWRKDRIDPGSFAEWLELLYAANPQRAVRQIKELDIELLSLLFKMHTRIYDIVEGEEIPEEPRLHSTTPDQRYLIVYDDSDGRLALSLRQTVERLFGVDMAFVLRLIEAVRWEMPSALEEEAFRWRNGRMSDLGFAPPGEAQSVFQYVDPERALFTSGPADESDEGAQPKAKVAGDEESTDLSTSVLLPADLLEEGAGVLQAALAQVSSARKRAVSHELMMLGNRLHVATGGDCGDGEALRATVQRAADTIGIALSYASRGDPLRLGIVLSTHHTLKLFQIGHSLGVRVARELRARTRSTTSGLAGEGLLRLDSPLREVAAGLLRPQPLFFSGLADPARSDYHPFSSLQELALTTKAVAEAAFRAELLERGLKVTDGRLLAVGVIDAATGPSHTPLFTTWLSRHLLTGEGDFAPLLDEELAQLRSLLAQEGLVQERVAATIETVVTQAAALAPLAGAVTPQEARERTASWAEQAFAALRGEFEALEADLPDGRYLASVFTVGSLSLQDRAEEPSAEEDPDDEEEFG